MRRASGGGVQHHRTYELHLADGRILRTRISRPIDQSAYGPSIWKHILRDQLDVNEEQFWACVQEGVLPHRGAPQAPEQALPMSLVWQLIHRAGLAEEAVSKMSKADAAAALAEYWQRQAQGGGPDA